VSGAKLTVLIIGATGIVFTHGSDGQSKAAAEQVDYGGVRNVLEALQGRPARIALMTAIGVTNRDGAYNRATQIHDWKRRGERLVRASGRPYTVVRPGWFDYNAADRIARVTAVALEEDQAPLARAALCRVGGRCRPSLDAIRDVENMPLAEEPAQVGDDISRRARGQADAASV